jgi:hypothetical protein
MRVGSRRPWPSVSRLKPLPLAPCTHYGPWSDRTIGLTPHSTGQRLQRESGTAGDSSLNLSQGPSPRAVIRVALLIDDRRNGRRGDPARIVANARQQT